MEPFLAIQIPAHLQKHIHISVYVIAAGEHLKDKIVAREFRIFKHRKLANKILHPLRKRRPAIENGTIDRLRHHNQILKTFRLRAKRYLVRWLELVYLSGKRKCKSDAARKNKCLFHLSSF